MADQVIQYRYSRFDEDDEQSDYWSEWEDLRLPTDMMAAWQGQRTQFRIKPSWEPGYYQWNGAEADEHESIIWIQFETGRNMKYWRRVVEFVYEKDKS